jgi:hypothetical protein
MVQEVSLHGRAPRRSGRNDSRGESGIGTDRLRVMIRYRRIKHPLKT